MWFGSNVFDLGLGCLIDWFFCDRVNFTLYYWWALWKSFLSSTIYRQILTYASDIYYKILLILNDAVLWPSMEYVYIYMYIYKINVVTLYNWKWSISTWSYATNEHDPNIVIALHSWTCSQGRVTRNTGSKGSFTSIWLSAGRGAKRQPPNSESLI